jgi:peptide/nickel transport system permease protein
MGASAALLREASATRAHHVRLRRFRLDPALAFSALVLGITVVCALIPGVLAPYPPNKLAVGPNLASPSWDHWVGTDEFGRDLLSRLISGARVELAIGLAAVALAVVVGVPFGVVAGARGGLADSVLMRLQDALLAFPSVLFAILVVAALGASQRSIILTIGVVYVPRFARLVRGSVLVLKDQEFVVASRAAGATDVRLMTRHILPNCFAPILVQITLAISVAILIEAGLSYLGLGVQPPTATWGTTLKAAQSELTAGAWWYVLAPGICIFAVVLALNTLGDGLRDRLDPRLRGL